ncbi:MAG: PT domain-containing protein, partial [Candidatus Helarchaeota archaeon]
EPVAEPTAEPVAEPTAEPVAEPTAEPVAEPTAEPVAEPVIETTVESLKGTIVSESLPNDQIQSDLTTESSEELVKSSSELHFEAKGEPVSTEDLNQISAEIAKVPRMPYSDVPVIPSEEVITEIKKKPVQEEVSLEDSVLISAAESMTKTISNDSDSFSASDLPSSSESPPVTEEDLESPIIAKIDSPEIPSPPKIPLISPHTKQELKSLLTPILQLKAPSIPNDIEKEIESKEQVSDESFSLQELTSLKKPSSSTPISATELLDETKMTENEFGTFHESVMLNKEDELLTTTEKEAKIIEAMEEVAALLPPGPAKEFIEEMMIKRTAHTNTNNPKIPQINTGNNNN